MGNLIIGDVAYPIDAPIVNFQDDPAWDSTTEHCVNQPRCLGVGAYGDHAKNHGARRFSARPALRRYGSKWHMPGGDKPPPLEAVQAVIRQFVLHHDGMYSAASCFNVLHNERGLSCHFLVDNDGTIYQTLDLAYCGFHASDVNPFSIGVEICNRGDAKKEPHYYDDKKRYPDRRDQKAIKVHSSKILAYDFTKAQYAGMSALARALTKLLPNLPVEYPQSAPGQQSWGLLPNYYGFSGYIGHYHLTTRKWDPGPFDFKEFCTKLRGTLCFPLWTGKKDATIKDRPEIPSDIDQLHERTTALIDANEQKADGGFFPVGPWGERKLWHGGIHIAGVDKEPVYAPFPGRVVAARMGKDTAVGSANFVLLRHDMTIGPAHARFFSLYMHLTDELKDGTPTPPWMGKDGWKERGKPGETILLDEPVEAGEVIGRMGKAGPDEISKAQIHFEIFSPDLLFQEFDGEKWQPVDGYSGGRFCDQPAINDLIDADKDKKLSRSELVDFYAGSGDRQGFRWLVTYHISEWTDTPAWSDALRMATDQDFGDLKPDEIDTLIDEQILPGLWWSEAVSRHAKLPRDGVVYHYHPMTFIQWLNEKILETALDPASQDEAVAEGDTTEVTGMSGDFDGGEGTDGDMISEGDLNGYAGDTDIALENLVEGYAGEPEEQ